MDGFDKTDIEILGMLQKDARLPYKVIAKRLKITIGTVHNRIARMKRKGLIKKFAPIIDTTKLGFKVRALIHLRIKPGGFDVPKKLRNHPNVLGVWTITGEHDNVIFAHFKDTDEMGEFVKKLQQETGTDKTNTTVILDRHEDEFQPKLEFLIEHKK